ncbi:MAG: 4a-hydroxytetrahydrobiopterin dehydratase [Acidimicrobiia bacterium]
MGTLAESEVRAALAGLDGWALAGAAIVKEFRFGGFPEAVAFVGRLVEPAEAADHHPDLDIRYNRVTVTLSTHSEGGVTPKDLALAPRIDALAGGG